jgi:hypothetical protein
MPAKGEEAKSGERPETGGLENAETVETEALVDDDFLEGFEIIRLDELDDEIIRLDELDDEFMLESLVELG